MEDFNEIIIGEFNQKELWKKRPYIEEKLQKEDHYYNFTNGIQINTIAKHIGVHFYYVEDAIHGSYKFPSDHIRVWADLIGKEYWKLKKLLDYTYENRRKIIDECKKEKRSLPHKFTNQRHKRSSDRRTFE
jgi:hypothetical protein